MAQTKKKNARNTPKISDEAFIREKSRSFPIGKCYLSSMSSTLSPVVVFVTRLRGNGKMMLGIFTIDQLCCGLVKSAINISFTEDEVMNMVNYTSDSNPMKEVSYDEAHNYIFGAIEFARQGGLEPDQSFSLTQYFLEEDTENIPLIEYEFGISGRHILQTNLYEDGILKRDVPTLKKKLKQALGNNFTITTFEDAMEMRKKNSLSSQTEPYSVATGPYPDSLHLNFPQLESLLIDPDKKRLSNYEISQIISLPRKELLADLHNIAMWVLGLVHGKKSDDMPSTAPFALRHVMAIITELKDPAAQPTVIALLKEPDEVTLHFFGEWASDFIGTALRFTTDATNLDLLEQLIILPGLFTWRRIDALVTLIDILILYPELRPRIIKIAENTLQHMIDNIASLNGCDPLTAGIGMEAFIQIGAPSFIPLVEKLFETGMVYEAFCGSCKNVVNMIKRGENLSGNGYCRSAEELYDCVAPIFHWYPFS